jgi:hypothetical protein
VALAPGGAPSAPGLELAVHRAGPISAGGVGRAATRAPSCRGSAGRRRAAGDPRRPERSGLLRALRRGTWSTPHTAGETRRYEDNVIEILSDNLAASGAARHDAYPNIGHPVPGAPFRANLVYDQRQQN